MKLSQQELRKRVLHHFGKEGKSLWRSYMNAYLQEVSVESPVLDAGSGGFGTASYHRWMPNLKEQEVISITIDTKMRPTIISNLRDPIPLASQTMQTCLGLNMLTYFYNFPAVIAEMDRILKPGGTLVLSVPFLDRIHSDEGDHLRYTSNSLRRMLTEQGFTNIEIVTCGAGALTASLFHITFLIPHRFRGWVLRFCWWLDTKITQRSGGRFRNADDYPLGYVARATKPHP